jgi:hypothetical protein
VSDIITVSATNEWDEFKTRTSRVTKTGGQQFGPQERPAPGVHMYTTDISVQRIRRRLRCHVNVRRARRPSSPVRCPRVANPLDLGASSRSIQQTAQDPGSPESTPVRHCRANACRVVGGAGCDDDGATDDDGICGALPSFSRPGAGRIAYLFRYRPACAPGAWRRMLRSARERHPERAEESGGGEKVRAAADLARRPRRARGAAGL